MEYIDCNAHKVGKVSILRPLTKNIFDIYLPHLVSFTFAMLFYLRTFAHECEKLNFIHERNANYKSRRKQIEFTSN